MAKDGYRTTTTIAGQKLSSPMFDTRGQLKDWQSAIGDARNRFRDGKEITAEQRRILEAAKFKFEVFEGDIYIEQLAAQFLSHRADQFVASTASFNMGHIRKYILPAFKGRNVYGIKKLEIKHFIQKLKLKDFKGYEDGDPNKPKYVDTNRSASSSLKHAVQVTFSLLYEFGKAEGILRETFPNPAQELEFEGSREADSDENLKFWLERRDILKVLKITRDGKDPLPPHPLLYAYAAVCVNGGPRKNEALAFTYDDLDERNGVIRVNKIQEQVSLEVQDRTKSGKGAKRIIPYPPEAQAAVAQWRSVSAHTKRHDFVFCREDGSPYSPRQILTEFDQYCQAAGVELISIHGLRHTFATHYIMEGGRVEILQKILGHRSIKTTMKYVHLVEGHIKTRIHVVSFGLPSEQPEHTDANEKTE